MNTQPRNSRPPAPNAPDPALDPTLARLPAILEGLEAGLVERRQVVRIALLVALAGEHTLLIGPPGTAKSELARRLHRAFAGARYFERLLTRFSVPEELFGPLSISALEQDRYERHTTGFLPDASIAFIDEVFKANSAILNALLTLLNEREFDNGAGRQRCPLISVIGATNAVPADEVGEAFFDRFLARLPVASVTDASFAALLAANLRHPPPIPALDEAERAAIAAAAEAVAVPETVVALLGELRRAQGDAATLVSDRRWVKIVRLLRTAAACEGRAEVSPWDLALIPPCVAADAVTQAQVAEWLAECLGARAACSPPRLRRIVEAFAAQLELEREAEDLQYDATGRLQFTDSVSDTLTDAKGSDDAPRLRYTRRRRYGEAHIGARLAQLADLARRIDGYAATLAEWRAEFRGYQTTSLWLDPAFAAAAERHLAETEVLLQALAAQTEALTEGFSALPRLAADPGIVPEAVAHEAFDGAP